MVRKRRLTLLHRLILNGVLHVVEHPKRILTIAAIVLIASALLAAWRLNISTDQDNLFSRDVPFFKNYINFTNDFPENQAIYILVEAKDSKSQPPVERWTAAADAIITGLSSRPDLIRSVDGRLPVAQLGDQSLLFEDPAKLPGEVADVAQFAPLAKLWGESPNSVTKLLGASPLERFISGVGLQPPDEKTADFVTQLADGWNKTLSQPDPKIQLGDQVPDLSTANAADPSQLGYYYLKDQQNPENHVLLIRVYERDDYTSMDSLANIVDGIRDSARRSVAAFPEFQVGTTGRPALEADEMITTDRDARRSEIVALIAVFIGLVLLLRSIWLAIAAEISLLVGIGWTFGWITLSVGELNLLSMVFLIALIGIGMDYLIQVLTRYRREAAVHSEPRVIWLAVFKHVAAPINTACLGAAGAFFVSVFTDFRGAAELGIIASGGLLLCLFTAYTVLPAILTLWPVKAGSAVQARFDPPAPSGKSHHRWLILPALWAILLLCGIPSARKAHFDPSLLNLQAQNLESVKLVRKLDTWSAVVLSDDLIMLRKVRSAVIHLPSVEGVDSWLGTEDNYDWLQQHQNQIPKINWSTPTAIQSADLPRLAGKATALADRLRKAAEGSAKSISFQSAATALEKFSSALTSTSTAERLSQWQIVFVDELKTLLARFHPSPPNPSAVPATLRDHYIGKDGKYALYLNPKQDLWVQANLARFVFEVEAAVAAVPGAPPVTGIAINVYHSTSSIEHSFYKAAAYALTLIFILVYIDMRDLRQTFLAISVLAMGLPMLVSLMGLFHISWNFANFFGLPILIGAGHEYGVFMVHRYNEACSDPRRTWQKWDVSDRALLLCGFVTSASFGFFWALGHHEGLKSLGLVMALGTACIYLATLCMLRPLLMWKLAQNPPRKINDK
jgi:uncharacterized protein